MAAPMRQAAGEDGSLGDSGRTIRYECGSAFGSMAAIEGLLTKARARLPTKVSAASIHPAVVALSM